MESPETVVGKLFYGQTNNPLSDSSILSTIYKQMVTNIHLDTRLSTCKRVRGIEVRIEDTLPPD